MCLCTLYKVLLYRGASCCAGLSCDRTAEPDRRAGAEREGLAMDEFSKLRMTCCRLLV